MFNEELIIGMLKRVFIYRKNQGITNQSFFYYCTKNFLFTFLKIHAVQDFFEFLSQSENLTLAFVLFRRAGDLFENLLAIFFNSGKFL